MLVFPFTWNVLNISTDSKRCWYFVASLIQQTLFHCKTYTFCHHSVDKFVEPYQDAIDRRFDSPRACYQCREVLPSFSSYLTCCVHFLYIGFADGVLSEISLPKKLIIFLCYCVPKNRESQCIVYVYKRHNISVFSSGKQLVVNEKQLSMVSCIYYKKSFPSFVPFPLVIEHTLI